MEWWQVVSIIFGSFVVLLLLGIPVAFAFFMINILSMLFLWGTTAPLHQLILSIYDSVTNFTLLPVPLFILMGEVMFHTGIAPKMMEALDKWLGRLPGRLALLAVAGGTIFATLSGSGVASCAMLGTVLLPEMQKRGYKEPMTLGPIMGSAGLAIMIPPSALGVVLAALAQISVAKLLIAIVMPGVLMAGIFATYIILRCYLQPSIAPIYQLKTTTLSDKIMSTVRYVLPLGSIIFLCIGVIFLGVTTPSEAAALAAVGCFILAFLYGGLNWQTAKKSIAGTVKVSAMMFMIFMGSASFAEILAYSGASQGLLEVVKGSGLSPIMTLICMQIILLIMGMFMEPMSILMVCLPIYMPIVKTLHFDPVWFCAIILLNMEMATISPPFGLTLYTMKGVAPPDTTMGDVYRSSYPFFLLDMVAMALMIIFPTVVLWLPGVMK